MRKTRKLDGAPVDERFLNRDDIRIGQPAPEVLELDLSGQARAVPGFHDHII
jgi:hypothetical protein